MSASVSQFLDAPAAEQASPPRVGILPVPYEATTSYGQGAVQGPQAILDASTQVEFYDEELDCESYRIGLQTHAPVDCQGVVGEQAILRIEAATQHVIAQGQWPLVLGGEHSISTGPVAACRQAYPGLGVLQIDAHGDLRDAYEGDSWSHASVMRRIHDMGCPSVGVGIRSLCVEERELIRQHALPRWFAYQMHESDAWMDAAIEALPEHVYITLDVDGLDPAIIRATGTPEPGGLGWYQTLRFLRKVFQSRNVVGADVVELAPSDNDPASSFATARLVYKMIGYYAEAAK